MSMKKRLARLAAIAILSTGVAVGATTPASAADSGSDSAQKIRIVKSGSQIQPLRDTGWD